MEKRTVFSLALKDDKVITAIKALKGLAQADLAKKDFGMNIYCFRYDFSVALISALALLKYTMLRLVVVVQKYI